VLQKGKKNSKLMVVVNIDVSTYVHSPLTGSLPQRNLIFDELQHSYRCSRFAFKYSSIPFFPNIPRKAIRTTWFLSLVSSIFFCVAIAASMQWYLHLSPSG
jgi:hypothetical protein